jgi:hypothetical protein
MTIVLDCSVTWLSTKTLTPGLQNLTATCIVIVMFLQDQYIISFGQSIG